VTAVNVVYPLGIPGCRP